MGCKLTQPFFANRKFELSTQIATLGVKITLDAVGAIAELLGTLGVILTLLYLSSQIE